jgi:hypothetical protein
MVKIFEHVGNKGGYAAVFHEEHTSEAAMTAVNRTRRQVETRRVTLLLQSCQLIEFIRGCIFGPYAEAVTAEPKPEGRTASAASRDNSAETESAFRESDASDREGPG